MASLTPYDGGFLFWGASPDKPVDHKTVGAWLYGVLEAIGIDEEAREARNITFHSWRHFANTVLRNASVPDHIVRHLTGHSTEAMTERYGHVALEHLEAVQKVQESL